MSDSYKTFNGSTALTSGAVWTWLSTTGANQTLTAGVHPTELTDSFGGSTLVGSSSDTTFQIGSSSSRIVEAANGGTDTVLAYAGYALPTDVENLSILVPHVTGAGNDGSNLLIAQALNVTLRGGAGNDVMVDKGAGQTVFDLSPGSGQDVIYGFKTGGAMHDFVKLGGYGFTSYQDVASHMTQVGSDVSITLSAKDTVTLRDTKVADLSAQDFLLSLDTSKMTLTFADEFDALSLYNGATGTGTWKTNYGWDVQNGSSSWRSRTLTPNHEQEIYVDPSYAGTGSKALGINPFSISNGVLDIHAAKTPAAALQALNNYQYTSGLLTTEKSHVQTYGYFEMRAELPAGKGAWPAFWLVPTDRVNPTELDVLETAGNDKIWSTSHWTQANGTSTGLAFSTDIDGATSGYHTYGVMWTKDTLTYYVDGNAVASADTPADMNKPMYMLVNLAIGGDFGGNAPADFTGADMKVDYIRSYSLEDVGSGSAPVTTPPVTAPAPVDGATLVGTDGADTLTGNGGSNVVKGLGGNDVLDGGGGNDTLTGGSGSDVFRFAVGGGKDVVTDFGANGDGDLIDISAYLAAKQKPVLADVGNDVVLTFASGDTITLEGVHADGLVATATGYKAGPGFLSQVGTDQKATTTAMWTHTWDKLGTAGDKDCFTIDLKSGYDMRFALEAGGSGMGTLADGKLSLYDPNGRLVASDDNSGSGADAALRYKVVTGGTYYLVVESADGGTGSYMLDSENGTMLFSDGGKLAGTAAADILVGSRLADTLSGGAGGDRFQMGLGGGKDTIADFGAGDVIDLMAFTQAGYKPTLVRQGGDTLISFGSGDSIKVLGTTPDHLKANYWGYTYG